MKLSHFENVLESHTKKHFVLKMDNRQADFLMNWK
jgi:hypothetical protein